MTGIQEPRPAQPTRWHVVTGGPSSGKTTTVNLLRDRGYTTTIEHARHYIDLQRITGRSTAEVRARQSEFQRAVVDMQIEQEHSLDPQQTVFLDRALPDSLAYYRFLNLEPDTALLGALAATRYATVFLLDLLPLAPDYARTEDPAAQRRITTCSGRCMRSWVSPSSPSPRSPRTCASNSSWNEHRPTGQLRGA
ncbi:ATP-binding protein [uncultured Microbacterium sp.]|uniref:ATP-binding protein n=1 Tax=uncultured Microbacterium sp. TaxID=191216 RepID=UPI00260D5EB3|nr:ATP-binding protein [uncultured Microbacterium sp.]